MNLKKILAIRIILNADGGVRYRAFYQNAVDWSTQDLPPAEALRVITSERVTLELATCSTTGKSIINEIILVS